jgi:hypothetical protein
MSSASPELVWDGFTEQSHGMNDGLSRFRLPVAQSALLINATTRGDFVRQRPGWDRIMTVLPQGLGFFQHFSWFKNDAGRVFLLVVAGGRIFRVDPVDLSVLEITIPGDPNPFTLAKGWSVQAEQFWIYNDGQTLPFIWDGGSARRAKKGELMPGTVLAYVQGRIWYGLPDGRSFRAGDLVGSDSGTLAYNYRDSVLKETENTFLNEGGNFSVPSEAGEIVAMRAPTILDTSQGQGPLLVVCENDAFSVNTPVDRTIWKSVNYPIQTVSLMGRGGYAQCSCINVAGDVWFRSRVNGDADGISSFVIARREFQDLGNVPQSFEVSTAIGFDQQNLLVYGSAGVYDNRLLMTFSPGFSNAGVYHRGLVALDLSPKNSIQAKAPPSYEGLWTGLNILAACPTSLGLYTIVLAGNGNFDLWKLSKNKTTDNNGPITWSHIPRALFQETTMDGTPGRTLKRLETCDYEYDELRGLVSFVTSWAPDSLTCLQEWHRWSECMTMCETIPDCPPNLNFQPGYQPRKRLPTPPDACSPGSLRPLRNFYTLQFRTDITGPARLLGVRIGATIQQEPKYEVNSCETTPCAPVRCCPNGALGGNLFTYDAPGSEGTPYYGPDYGTPYPSSPGYPPGGQPGGVYIVQPYPSGGGYDYEPPEDDTEGGPPLPNLIPVWPAPTPEETPCGENYAIFLGIVMEDKLQGITRPVGTSVAPGVDPATSLSAGVLEKWAQEVWNQYLLQYPYTGTETLVWWEIHNTGLEWMANQVFQNPAGNWNGVIDLDWKLTILYCTG